MTSDSGKVLEQALQSNDMARVRTGMLAMSDMRSRRHGWYSAMISSTHSRRFMDALITSAIEVDCLEQLALKEFLPSLIQEEILRGADFSCNDTVQKFWSTLKICEEPLVWLPLQRTSAETTLDSFLPNHSLNGLSCCIPAFTQTKTANSQIHDEALPRDFNLVQDFSEVAATRLDDMCTEAKQFRFAQKLKTSDVSSQLLSHLGLECLSGADIENTVVNSIQLSEAIQPVFGFASNGGAYGSGVGVATGRLYAWQTLAALAGCNSEETFLNVEKCINQSSWFAFSSDGDWFCNVAWDLGLICLHEDRYNLSVLAATTED